MSGLGKYLGEAPILVAAGICKNPDQSVIEDGFASWPSGHSSFSMSGLLYFSLWICGKFGAAVPTTASVGSWRTGRASSTLARSAAPPVYLLVLALIPFSAAVYICASRWADNQHNGWDILGGASIGVLFAWLGYRLYHPPLQNLIVSNWGPRAKAHAFYGSLSLNDLNDRSEQREGENTELEGV